MMYRIIPLLCLLFLFNSKGFSQDSTAVKYAQIITKEVVSDYLHVLASDSLEGREAGTAGQKKAANYIRAKFTEFGLLPIVQTDSGKSYFQQFELTKRAWDKVFIQVGGKKKKFLEDFYAYGDLEFPEPEKLEIVFGGYGIDSRNYSDYENIDVSGKGVIVFMGEPVINDTSLVTGTTELSEWAFDWRKKASEAKSKGAKAVFVVVGKSYSEFEVKLSSLKHHLSKPMLSFTYKERGGSAFFVPAKLAAEMLKTDESKLLEAKNNLAANQSHSFSSAKVKVLVSLKKESFTTENVLGYLEGNSLKDEVIVITAHYDHLGVEGEHIYYGADDDGSGTSAVIALAKAFAEAAENGFKPERSILFMPVTAEEKGLLGSEYYSDNPEIPLEQTVANLNIDMIGRIDKAHDHPDYVYLIGSDRLSSTLHKVSQEAASVYMPEIELDYTFNRKDDPNRFYYRSDHYNFARNNIPVIFFFNGVHEDYHQPTDTVDKINFEKVANITRLIFFTAWELANLESPIEVDVEQE